MGLHTPYWADLLGLLHKLAYGPAYKLLGQLLGCIKIYGPVSTYWANFLGCIHIIEPTFRAAYTLLGRYWGQLMSLHTRYWAVTWAHFPVIRAN